MKTKVPPGWIENELAKARNVLLIIFFLMMAGLAYMDYYMFELSEPIFQVSFLVFSTLALIVVLLIIYLNMRYHNSISRNYRNASPPSLETFKNRVVTILDEFKDVSGSHQDYTYQRGGISTFTFRSTRDRRDWLEFQMITSLVTVKVTISRTAVHYTPYVEKIMAGYRPI